MFELIGLGFLQIFLLIIGSALGVVFAVAVSLSTRGISRGRRRAQVIAFVFPSIALFYMEAGFFSQALVREVLGEDNFLNGFYHYPLGNGHQLVIWNEDPKSGYIEQSQRGIVANDVRAIHAAGNVVFVSRYEGQDATDLSTDKPANRYSVIDTRTSKVTDYPTLDALRSIAAGEGISLRLMTTEEAFLQAQSAEGPGRMLLAVLFMPLIVASIWLLIKLRRLCRTRPLGASI
jgi:hypothetical protein